MGDCTKNFSYKDFIVSATAPEALEGIEFTPHQKARIFLLCSTILQPARDYVNRPIFVDNGIRTQKLYEALIVAGYKPSQTSNHFYKEPDDVAADVATGDFDVNETFFQFIRSRLPHAFGQLIAYRNKDGKIKHVHVDLPTPSHQGEVWVSHQGQDKLARMPSSSLGSV